MEIPNTLLRFPDWALLLMTAQPLKAHCNAASLAIFIAVFMSIACLHPSL